jgi:hypothetical protein
MIAQNHPPREARSAKTPAAPPGPKRLVRDVIIVTAGFFIILLGVLLLFLPGPGLLLIAVGAGLVASRFNRVRARVRN